MPNSEILDRLVAFSIEVCYFRIHDDIFYCDWHMIENEVWMSFSKNLGQVL